MSYQREYEKKLRVGMIGIGSHTYRNLLPAMNFLPVHLQAMCVKQDMERAKVTAAQYGGCAVYQDPAQMYEREELDAVFICVSERAHPSLVCGALDAGLHVWLEKPPAVRASEVEGMIRHRGDRVVVVGFKKAFMPSAFKAREVARSAEYGNLKSCLAIYPMNLPQDGARVLEKSQVINWLGNGVHPLSFLISVGGRVEAVTTHTNGEGYGICVLAFENGVMGNFHLASGPHPLETYALYGASWHLTIANSTKVILQRGTPLEYGVTTTFAPEGFDSGAVVWEASFCLATLENKALFIQGIYNEMNYFCDCALSGETAEHGSLEFALEVMRVYEAALLSNGQTVQVH
jgi:predicted dehydrogenase